MKQKQEQIILGFENHDFEVPENTNEFKLQDTFSKYIKDISKIPLLSSHEEMTLLKKFSISRKSQDAELIKRGEEAREKLIVSNLRLVMSIAKKYSYSNIPFMDLVQEGTMGLIKAIDRYEIDKGVKLSTYATWWIRQAVTRFISNTSRTIRLPVYICDMIYLVKRATREYINQNGNEPDLETVSKLTDIPIATLRLLELYNIDTISLDKTIGDDDSSIMDSTKDESNLNPEEYNHQIELEEFVLDVLKILSEREQQIIKMRFGIQCEEKTLEEIGNMFEVSRERIRQIEVRAIKKIKKHIH